MNQQDRHRLSRRSHAAMAQFHRWFQLYEKLHERPTWTEDLVERQLQIFAEEFQLFTADGRTVDTRDAYRRGVRAYSSQERHSHHVDRLTVVELDAHRLGISAEVDYQHLDASGAVTAARINYEGELVGPVDSEPLFTRLKMSVARRTRGEEFADAYPANRALSVVHRFLSLVEAPEQGPYGLDEIIAPDGELDLAFDTRTIRDRRELAARLSQWAHHVAPGTSRHTVGDFHLLAAENDRYAIAMDLDWHATSTDGSPLAARMRHDWTLRDDGGRYCRIVRARSTPQGPPRA